MNRFRVNLAGIDFTDEKFELLETKNIPELEFNRKGDIWNPRTGKKLKNNIVRLKTNVSYQEGYILKIDHLISLLESDTELKEIFLSCDEVELQIRVGALVDDKQGIPYLGLNPHQMEYLAKIGARVDVSIIIYTQIP